MGFVMQNMLDHFGLSRRPFSLIPDPDFLCLTPQHARARSVLDYGLLSCAPITLLTGDIGVGKTTMLREFLKRAPHDIKIGLICNAVPSNTIEMLRLVLHALGQIPTEGESGAALYAQLEAHLVAEYASGHRVVLVFDEAQKLGRNALEHLRMLTNINYAEHELLQLVLIGQTNLLTLVNRPDMEQVAQRISAHMHLTRLSEQEVETYLNVRLEAAGGESGIFAAGSAGMIFQQTSGTPRLINQLCDYALLYAYAAGEGIVTSRSIASVINDRTILSLSDDAGGILSLNAA